MATIVPYPDDKASLQALHEKQSYEVPGTLRPGQTGHYRNAHWPELITTSYRQPWPIQIHTLNDCFKSGLINSRDRSFLGYRPLVSANPLVYAKEYVWQTYAEVEVRRKSIGSALYALFSSGKLSITEEGYKCVGIWSPNRPEWQIIDLASQAYNLVSVSLYDTLGPEAVEFIMQHAQLSIVFVTPQHIPALLALSAKCPLLKVIVSIDTLPTLTKDVLEAWGRDKGIEIISFEDFEAKGKANPVEPIIATPDQIATICYTSGTTSMPKGALLTHSQLALSAVSCIFGSKWENDGALLSYLPLAHIYERIAELIVTTFGGRIAYFTGDPSRLLEDAQIARPNYFPSVPRVLNRVYNAVQASMEAPGLKGALLRKAVAVKLKQLRETGKQTHPLWDRLVFRKIQAMLGGKIFILTCGSAPIGIEVIEFLKIALGSHVVEGQYGMTENAATCTRTIPTDNTSGGTIGCPQPVNEMKLVDVPQMGYTSKDKPNPRGEICVRGANCFVGYYRDAKATKETIDEEGWLHTGDVGEVDTHGRFKIIDRIKNIMKLAQGEYVALEKVENAYSTCPAIAQIYIHGDSLQDHLLAVVVPDPVQLAEIAGKNGVAKVDPSDTKALEKLVQDQRVVDLIHKELNKEAKKQGLKGFETARRIHLTLELFSTENGLLTPTFKIRRKDAYKKYKNVLDALYASPTQGGSKL